MRGRRGRAARAVGSSASSGADVGALGSVDWLAAPDCGGEMPWEQAGEALAALGFERSGIVEVIERAERRMFFKSMTTFADHRVWQDVYHVPARDLILYVKFQADVVTEFRVMAFKEK